MKFTVYEDPENNRSSGTMNVSSRKPLPMGRTPLGKRTNQNTDLGRLKGTTSNKTEKEIQHDDSSSTLVQPRERTPKPTVRFGELNDPENGRSVSKTSPLNEFRQSLRSKRQTPGPSATAGREARLSKVMSPHTLLLKEMESIPDDSLLLVSPNAEQGPNGRSRLAASVAVPTTGRGPGLAQKPNGILRHHHLVKMTGAARGLDTNKAIDGKKSNSSLVAKSNKEQTNNETIANAAGTRSSKSNNLPSSRQHQSQILGDSVDDTIEDVALKKQKPSKPRTTINGQSFRSLRVKTELNLDEAPKPPPTQTNHASAWKSAQISTSVGSPILSSPAGICLDLSSTFNNVQTCRPPKSMPKSLTKSVRERITPSIENRIHSTPELLASQAQHQSEMFSAWLNATLCPEEDSSVENDPWRSLAVHQRMSHIRQTARDVWKSEEMQKIRIKVESEVYGGKLRIREDRDMYADLTHRRTILQLLMESYETPWLRLGLETVFGVLIEPKTRSKSNGKFDLKPVERSKLSRMQVALRDFIVNRVLSNASILSKYTKGKCKVPSGQFEVDYKAELRTHVLQRLLLLFFFLDQAKHAHLLEQTLFQRQSAYKSSKEIFGAFCRLFLSSSGDIVKHFQRLGLRVHHVQRPLDEVNFEVKNIAMDLRDGIRLARMTEILLGSKYQSLLCRLRIPAASRLPKIHNVKIVLEHLSEQFTLPVGVAAHHIVDSHREKVLQLLWCVIAHFCLPHFLDSNLVRQEIGRINQIRGLQSNAGLQERTEVLDENEMIHLLLHWANTVLSEYGIQVGNMSADWADGVPCCLLINFYHPDMLTSKEIRLTRRNDFFSRGKVAKKIQPETLRKNEHHNWELAANRMSQLGATTTLPSANSENPPNERTTLMCLAFLCQRLLESRLQLQACRMLQRVVRRKQRLKDLSSKICAARIIGRTWMKHKQNYYRAQRLKYFASVNQIEKFVQERKLRLGRLKILRLRGKAATRVQALVRRFVARSFYISELNTRLAAIRIQSMWRRMKAKIELRSLQKRVVAVERLQMWWREQLRLGRVRQHASILIQTRWRGFWTRIQEDFRILDAMDLQKYIRRGLAVLKARRRRRAVAVLQRISRRYLSSQKAKEVRRERLRQTAASRIQKYVRKIIRHRNFYAAQSIQSYWRRKVNQEYYSRIRLNAVAVQAYIRKRQARSRYLGLLESCVSVQNLWRRKVAYDCFKLKLNSAIIIQSFWRSRNDQTNFARARVAATLIQSYVRRQICVNRLDRFRSNTILLQNMWRCKTKRSRFKMIRQKAVLCQSVIRAYLGKKRFGDSLRAAIRMQSISRMWRSKALVRVEIEKENTRKNTAAILIQTTWRMSRFHSHFHRIVVFATCLQASFRRNSARKHFSKSKKAAVSIQATFRMHLAYKVLSHLRVVHKERLRREKWAATTVQRFIRGFLLRRQVDLCHQAAVNLQTTFRRHVAETNFMLYRLTVVTLQSQVRKRIAKREACVRTAAIVAIQRAFRSHMKSYKAARTIQTLWRCYVSNANYCVLQWATIFVQARRRGCLAVRERHRRVFAVYVLQGFGKRVLEKKRFAQYVEIVVKVQSLARRFLVFRKNELQYTAASIVQRCMRAYILRQKMLRMDLAALNIQRIWRGYDAHENYIWSRMAAIAIQAAFRRLRAQLLVMDIRAREWESAATFIQKVWRGYRTRCRCISLLDCVTILQSRFRGSIVRRRRSRSLRNITIRLMSCETSPQLRLDNRMKQALHILSTYHKLEELEKPLDFLKKATQWTSECCSKFIQAGATSLVFDLIRTCNRSLPHRQIRQNCLEILLNVFKHYGWDDSCPYAAEVCVDLVQLYRDDAAIFEPAVSLLYRGLDASRQVHRFCSGDEVKKRLDRVHEMLKQRDRHGKSRKMAKAVKKLGQIVRRV